MASESKGKKDEAHTVADIKLTVDENQLEQLVHDFNVAVAEIVGADKSSPIRTEYEKLYRALKKSRESEKRLMNKCRDLHADLLKNANKAASLQEEQNNQANLQKENKRAWEMIDELKRKDVSNNEKLNEAKTELARLTKLLEQSGGLDMGDSKYSFKELAKMKTEIENQLQEQLRVSQELREQLAKALDAGKEFTEEKQELNSRMLNMSYEVAGMKAEIQREVRRRERLEADLRKSRQDGEIKGEEITRLTQQNDKLTNELMQIETQFKEQKLIADRSQKEADSLQDQLARSQDEYDKAAGRAAKATEELQELKGLYKLMEEDLTGLKMEVMKGNRQRDTIQRKMHQAEESKREVEDQRDMFQAQIVLLEKTIDTMKRQADADRKGMAQVQRERDMLDANCRKAASEVTKQTSMAKQGEQAIRNLDTEINNYKAEAQKQRQIIYQLEKDRDRYINEAADLTQKVLRHIEELKVRESDIFDLKKQYAECETKLKQQQNLYEAVRSDRNLYSKNLMESQDEITEIKRKLIVTQHTIEQLREEVSTRETNLAKEHLEKKAVMAERDMLNGEVTRFREQVAEMKTFIDRQRQEGARLLRIIQDSDALATKQRKELDIIVAERDVLGTQLIRRNDELVLLYEKIKIQQSVLAKGEQGYRQRIEDIRILKLEVRRLKRELGKANTVASQTLELRNDYFHLQREVLREKARCKALEEELSRPLNLHRWRKLEGSDPSSFELIKKTQYLQRRMIRKVQMLAQANMAIQEKDKLYLELKRILSRQPGSEVYEKVSQYQLSLRSRTKQMQAMAGEMNMFESRAVENRYESDRIVEELKMLKKKYFVEKRKNQAAMTALSILRQQQHTQIETQLLGGAKDGDGGTASNFNQTNARTLISSSFGHTIPPPSVATMATTAMTTTTNTKRLPAIQRRPRQERFAGGGFNITKPRGIYEKH